MSFITVHGRTPEQRHQPVSLHCIKEIKQSIQVPVIANGDVKTLQDAYNTQKKTGCHGKIVNNN